MLAAPNAARSPMNPIATRRLVCLIIASATLMLAVSRPAAAGWKDWVDGFINSPASPVSQSLGSLTQTEMVAGLREALSQGAKIAVAQLGRPDGYWKNPRVQLPLPGAVASAQPFLKSIGQGHQVDAFHESMNRAAEQAVPEGLQILQQSISSMSFSDARAILNGPDDAATKFFEGSSRAQLDERFQPIIGNALNQVGVTSRYEGLVNQSRPAMAMLGREPESLKAFTTSKALDGLFTRLADEEGRIRRDPAARSSELLKKVFSQSR